MSIVDLIVVLVVIGLLFWVVRTLIPALGIPEPIGTVIYVILVVVVVLYLIGLVTGHAPSLRLT
jgi:hypothetical protein